MYRSLRYLSNSVSATNYSVYVSQSNDIFTNLAFEDWLYTNREFDDHNILMLWSNDPCVVIGRYQNPWLEANIPFMASTGVQLARRKSGGGTVYQDRGNLNLTFFTSKKQYNRRHNLEFITRAVYKNYGVQININKRDDLTLRGFKISGTAAKLGRLNAYHHCTLLVDANKVNLRQTLQKNDLNIKTNATKSVTSTIMNMCDESPSINVSNLLETIGKEYTNVGEISYINPVDESFPGLSKIHAELSSWDWCYGHSPKFTITKSFLVPNCFTKGIFDAELNISIAVENGRITQVEFNDCLGLFKTHINVATHLKNCQFSQQAFNSISHLLLEDEISFDVADFRGKLTKTCDDALGSIETLNLDNIERRRAIVSHASEFAQKIQEAVNKIFKTFVRVNERYSHRTLPQVALHLNDVVHQVQEVLITKPTSLKHNLKENIHKVKEEASKLLEIVQYYEENIDEGRLSSDVKGVVEKLIDAIYQLYVRNDVHHNSHDINAKTYEDLSKQILETLNKISWHDRRTVELLTKAGYSFYHILGHIVYHFKSEIVHLDSSQSSAFEDICKHITELRSQLETVLRNNDWNNVSKKTEDLKTHLHLTIHNFDIQVQRLIKIGNTLSGEHNIVTDNCIKNIVADSLHAEQRVLWKLQDIMRSHDR
ncbi:hypothetical protein FQA39_LY14878 [Lamprigera yunnana]|nr:hypothetical protein FQA39_LY14878 [Lamprigera yunnana]